MDGWMDRIFIMHARCANVYVCLSVYMYVYVHMGDRQNMDGWMGQKYG